ncbi:MAG: histidine kinase [Propionibacteriales bacterium]|nr:histidine kinase [Propionibacteriales bacterium]
MPIPPSVNRLARQLVGIALTPGDALLLPVLIIVRVARHGRGNADDLADRSIAAHGRRHGAARDEWPRGRRVLEYLAARVPLGLLDGILVGLISYGLVVTAQVIIAAITGGAAPLLDLPDAGRITWPTVLMLMPLGGFTLFLGCSALWATNALDRSWWHRCGQDPRALERHLRTTRAEVIEAVDGERRRIERDLHDGAQQGLVSLGLLIGRARRAPESEAAALLAQAHTQSLRLLDDLRTVTQQVYPVNLDRHGLERALHELAEHSALEVKVRCNVAGRPTHAVEVATWFVAAEGLSNAMKHTRSERIGIDVTGDEHTLRLVLTDEGPGGADPDGAGLTGLRQRVAALDGRLEVHSPSGGPTQLIMEVPCE